MKSGKRTVSATNGPESALSKEQDKGKEKIETEEEEEESEGEEEEDENVGSEEEGEDEQEGEAVEERTKLDDGFYEIEDVRKKRTRKGEVQYLIKWRGWPETANTWEPVDNLHSCREIIDAFEERSSRSCRKRRRKTHYSSKKKRTTPFVFHFRSNNKSEKKGQRPIEARNRPEIATGAINPQAAPTVVVNSEAREEEDEEVRSDVTAKGEEGEEPISTSARINDVDADKKNANTKEVKQDTGCKNVANGTKEGNAGRISIEFQDIGTLMSPINGDDGSGNKANSEAGQNDRITGAKKRKSGNVRRFKKDSTGPEQKEFNSPNAAEPCIRKDGVSPAESIEGEGVNSVKDRELSSSIVQIIKAVSYTTSTIDKVQKAAVSFTALRSDGQEVMVDNEYLKASNPLLLIDFYEQHLRYSPV